MDRFQGFVHSSKGEMINPHLRIIISLGRLNQETGGTQEIDVYFDKNISKENVLIRACESPYYMASSSKKIVNDPEKLITFISLDRVKLFSFGFSSRLVDDCLLWECELNDYSISLNEFSIKKEKIPVVSDNSAEFISYVLLNCWKMEGWPSIYNKNFDKIEWVINREVSLYIDEARRDILRGSGEEFTIIGAKGVSR